MRAWRRIRVTAFSIIVATSALTSIAASPAAAEGTIRLSPGATAIPGQYIVVLKGDTAAVQRPQQAAADLVSRYGGTADAVWEHALQGFALRASEEQARALAADPQVSYVEQDTVIRLANVQNLISSQGNLDRIDQRFGALDSKYFYLGVGGKNVNAYVLDTGIRLAHNEFGGRAKWAFNAVDSNNTDCHGHGTNVAGVIGGTTFGVAKSVNLFAVKVFGCAAEGSLSNGLSGVNWVTQHAVKPAVANMSFLVEANSTMDNAVRTSIASGITYVVASGNGDPDFHLGENACNFSPGRLPEAITVNAMNNSSVAEPFSNFGSCTDIYAPGRDIIAASNTSNTAIQKSTGTSFATPHVTGVVALHLQRYPAHTPQQVTDLLLRMAPVGTLTGVPAGTPNRRLYSRYTMDRPRGDFTGDGRTDLTVWRPSTGVWFTLNVSTTQWGQAGDVPVSGDYNGDGVTDIAVWRPSTGFWHIRNVSSEQLGQAGDIPVPGDYNGDGITDLAVWRPSNGTWFISGQVFPTQWGQLGDIPVPADYNGDGRTDLAVWRPSDGFWHIRNAGSTQWGQIGDKPVVADYNGDGRADLAIWRPSDGFWHIRNISSTSWGVNGDIPVAADYNGDGRADHAVWRPSTATWFLLHDGVPVQWGQFGDIPVVS